MAEQIKYAVGPDGRLVNYEPHHQTLKAAWREATEDEIAALVAKQDESAVVVEVAHESVVELTSE